MRKVGRCIAEGGNDFWGIEHHELPKGNGKAQSGPASNDLSFANDRDSGLWIFRCTAAKEPLAAGRRRER